MLNSLGRVPIQECNHNRVQGHSRPRDVVAAASHFHIFFGHCSFLTLILAKASSPTHRIFYPLVTFPITISPSVRSRFCPLPRLQSSHPLADRPHSSSSWSPFFSIFFHSASSPRSSPTSSFSSRAAISPAPQPSPAISDSPGH